MESRAERNIPKFNGDCYGAWKFRIKTVLEELQAYSVIEGPPPENPDAEWTAKNATAKCTIVNFLGDAFLHLAAGSATAKTIIDGLDRLYERRNLTAQVALRKQLSNLQLLPNARLSQHFAIFDNLISELISSGANIDEMDKVCQLLATLPSCYDGVIGPLEEFYGDNFNLAFVKTYLLDKEAKMEMETVTKIKDTITKGPNKRNKPNNYNQYNPGFQYRNPSSSTSQMYCEFCGLNNHFIQNCRFYNQTARPGERNIFPAMFPLCARKPPKRLKKNTFINNTKTRRLANINPYSVPNVKVEDSVIKMQTVKEEPANVKLEPVEIKEEPVWVKLEPQWGEQPIKMEPGTDYSTQGVYVNTEGTDNVLVQPEPTTHSSTQGAVYLQIVPNRENIPRKKKFYSKKRAQKRARQIAKLMMLGGNGSDVSGTKQQLLTNLDQSVQGSGS